MWQLDFQRGHHVPSCACELPCGHDLEAPGCHRCTVMAVQKRRRAAQAQSWRGMTSGARPHCCTRLQVGPAHSSQLVTWLNLCEGSSTY